MSNDNIISFEDYRKEKIGNSYQEDFLSELFKKDLRDQKDLIEWYGFHNRFNKYKLFAHCFFTDNQQEGNKNSENFGDVLYKLYKQ